VLDSWAQKADVPTGGLVGREEVSGFSIGNKGYIGPGLGNDTTPPTTGMTFNNSFWEYDPGTNLWTQKTTLPSTPRRMYVGFAINGKGYFGTGQYGVSRDDFWEYDPGSDSWTQKANLTGGARYHAAGFSLLGKGYIGTGDDGFNNLYDDFWEYDPLTNIWTQKADYPSDSVAGAACFGIDSVGKGYIGTGFLYVSGMTNSFYEYDPVSNTWTPRATFPGGIRISASGFSINFKGYFSCGRPPSGTLYTDLWEYTPPTPVGINDASVSSVSIYPNPSNGIFQINSSLQKGEVEIYSVKGEKVFSSLITNSSTTINLSTQPAGIYFVRVMAEGKSYSQKIVKE
jgi:N-acetylneuraminic acid mutarotase